MLPNWTDGYVAVKGAQMHYTRTGAGSAKPQLVLSHGFSDAGLCWLPVARDLQGKYDVILPDARGHGLSARVSLGETWDLAEDLAGVIRGLGLDRPVVGGHSMGANTSAMLGARYPELARALVLEDPPWFAAPPAPREEKPGEPDPWITALIAMKDLPVEALIAQCRIDNPAWPEVELPPWAESKKQFDTNFARNRVPLENWRGVAGAITLPTLLITADPERHAIVTPAAAAEAARLSASIQTVNVPNAGHNIRRENYSVYMAAVKKFLEVVE